MTKSIVHTDLRRLFRSRAGAPCQEGTALLLAFAETRPTDIAFLQETDMCDRTNSAFAGIPEWDAFAEHYASCKHCNA
jgi:hypothetical protein